MQFANMQIISPTVFNVDSHLTTLSLHAGQHWPLWDLLVISKCSGRLLCRCLRWYVTDRA